MLKALLVLLFFLGNVFCPEKDVAVDTVCYDTQAGYPLHLYVIRPADADTLLPCVLYVPGSAWKKQGMRLHASDFGVDTDNFFAWGSSSGAHVFLLQALTQDTPLLDNGSLPVVSCRVKAVVDYYGPTELVREFRIKDGYQENPDANGGLLLGDPVWEKRDIALKASPLYYVHPYAVPVFIVHGDQDKVVPLDQATSFVARMEECGRRSSICCWRGRLMARPVSGPERCLTRWPPFSGGI